MLASNSFRRRSGQVRRDLLSTSTVDFGRCNGAPNLGLFIMIARSVLWAAYERFRQGTGFNRYGYPASRSHSCGQYTDRTERGGFFSTNARTRTNRHALPSCLPNLGISILVSHSDLVSRMLTGRAESRFLQHKRQRNQRGVQTSRLHLAPYLGMQIHPDSQLVPLESVPIGRAEIHPPSCTVSRYVDSP